MAVGELAVGELAAVVVILLAGALGGAGALEQASSALGAAAGHLHYQGHGEGALGESGTGQEGAETTVPLHQILAAHRADLLGHGGLGAHIFAGCCLVQMVGKAAVIEAAEHLLPLHITLGHIVQMLLHLGGELQIGDVGEILLHPRRHRLTQIGDEEMLAFLLHIAAVQNGGHGGCVGRGTADAVLLHSANEGGLGVVCRRLGKVLGRLKALQHKGVTLVEFRQRRLLFLLVLVVAAVLIHGGKTGELQSAGTAAEAVDIGADFHAECIVHGVLHLAGQKTAPDKAVELILLGGQIAADILGGQRHIAGTDGFVGILRSALGLVLAGLGGAVCLAIALGNEAAGGALCLSRDAQRVGTHIGDKTYGAHARDIHALVELLGDGHGTAGCHVDLAAGLLLQGRGGEGGRGGALLITALDGGNGEGRTLQSLGNGAHIGLGIQFLLLAAHAVVMGLEGGRHILL